MLSTETAAALLVTASAIASATTSGRSGARPPGGAEWGMWQVPVETPVPGYTMYETSELLVGYA